MKSSRIILSIGHLKMKHADKVNMDVTNFRTIPKRFGVWKNVQNDSKTNRQAEEL